VISGLSDRYRVLSTLGTGGMGVVYKALDTSLNRPVAIKAIRPQALDDQSARRLRAEALAAASLDHPYICKVYELVETAHETLIVMEFVEGETLASKLARGVPPLEATLLMGSEISEGLSAAHARGIVHRDIKPSNVMITPHGHVKILDFGLAHSVETDEAKRRTQTGSQSRTGSPAYMSPEQARGLDIQPASDLFSLGVVLYECLSGRLPFDGNTGYEYVANLMAQKPVPLAPLAPEAPFALVQLVERCLEKDPGWRPESAEEVGRELRLQLEAGARGAAASSVARWSAGRFRLSTAAAVAAVALLAAGFGLRDRIWPGSHALDAAREMLPLVTWASNEQDSKLSPDGTWVSFLSDRDGTQRLYVQPIDGGEAREISVEGAVHAHVWSPDGRRIAAYASTGSGVFLMLVPAFFGGTIERSIALPGAASATARLVRWIGDDVYLATDSARGREGRTLTRIRLSDGAIDNATPRAGEQPLQFQWLDVHPATGMLVVSAVKDEQEDLWLTDATGARARQITNDRYFDRFPLWTGDIVTFQSNRGGQIDLWQIDPTSGRTRLVSSSESDERPESASLDGSLVTFQQQHANARLLRLTPSTGLEAQLTNDALSDFAPSASADGRTLIFQRHAGSPSLGGTLLDSQLFLARDGGAEAARAVSAGFFPRVSPGGGQVAYFGRQSSASLYASLFVKDLASGQTRTVSSQCPLQGFSMSPVEWIQQNLAWSPDGSLFFVEQGDAGPLVRRFDPRDGVTASVTGVLEPRVRVVDLHPSPDGSELGYLLYHDGAFQVRRRMLATGEDQVVGRWPGRPADVYLKGWSDDGALIVILRHTNVTGAEAPVMEVFAATPQGTRRVARLPRAHAVSARMSRGGRTLFYTGTIDRANNIFALALATGAVLRLTSNQLASVEFSGIEPLADGSLIVAQNDRRQDIWLSRASTPRSGQ
jgi:eukaryotic-like serine/threonine-protein kinase